MPSPFPGMNPYLEHPRFWHGFHERFVSAAANAIEAKLGPRYFVEIEQTVYVREIPGDRPAFVGRPDVYVTRQDEPEVARDAAATSTTLEAPARVRLPRVDVIRESFLEVRDSAGEEVVAVLELLSPSNKKPGPDREQYLVTRAVLLQSPAHVVEIDLLRGGGPRMPTEGLPRCDYYVVVSRAEARPDAGVWPIQLRDRLPAIPVPLRGADEKIDLDLQALVDGIYDAAGYAKRIYTIDPEPPLSPDDARWADQLVRSARPG